MRAAWILTRLRRLKSGPPGASPVARLAAGWLPHLRTRSSKGAACVRQADVDDRVAVAAVLLARQAEASLDSARTPGIARPWSSAFSSAPIAREMVILRGALARALVRQLTRDAQPPLLR